MGFLDAILISLILGIGWISTYNSWSKEKNQLTLEINQLKNDISNLKKQHFKNIDEQQKEHMIEIIKLIKNCPTFQAENIYSQLKDDDLLYDFKEAKSLKLKKEILFKLGNKEK